MRKTLWIFSLSVATLILSFTGLPSFAELKPPENVAPVPILKEIPPEVIEELLIQKKTEVTKKVPVVGEKKIQVIKETKEPVIELAILLDTSGSMSGLINQARTHLWKIVNELATAKHKGKAPALKVALYEYGKSSLPKSEGYLTQLVPLTDDLDTISEKLFALRTNGGSEYCGHVIQSATNELQWSKGDKALKLIYIAGNEPFSQGSVDYKSACSNAIKNGIVVNTIFCGNHEQGVQTFWKDGAMMADGDYLSINHNARVKAVATPYDAEISKLSGSVNKTYLFYGKRGIALEAKTNQSIQDSNAGNSSSSIAADRAAFKASGAYRTKNDLIDALADKKIKLEQLSEEEMPEELKKLDKKEREELITKKSKDREEIQKKIRELTKKRDKFVADARKKEAKGAKPTTFDSALIKSIRKQGQKKNFKFEKK